MTVSCECWWRAGINVAQIVILAPLFVFCWYMRKWETQDLVPIRPMEGEELPANMVRAGCTHDAKRLLASPCWRAEYTCIEASVSKCTVLGGSSPFQLASFMTTTNLCVSAKTP